VYIIVGDVIGEVVEANTSSIKIKVTWTTTTPPKNAPPVHSNWNQGSQPRTAKQLYEHQLKMQQALARHMEYIAAHSKVHTHEHEYLFDYTPDAQARIQHLPPKYDDNGKKILYSPAEAQKLKGNPTIPGWKADLSEIKVGQAVEVHVVTLQTAEKDKEKDKKDLLLARWVLILNDSTQQLAEKSKDK
jgi:hypothetical protein